MKEGRRLGVGVIGCGHISAAYCRLMPLFGSIALRAVADLDAEAAKMRGAEAGVPATSPEALLADPAIDIVVNLTPPAAHFDVSMAALAAGKHVYSEKPLVLTSGEGAALKRAADAAGLAVAAAPDTFLGGAHQQARKLVDDGVIGEVISGTCHIMSFGMEHWHPNPGFYFRLGGGPVFDMGPYYVSALVNLLGPVASVTAVGNRGRSERLVGSGPRQGEVIPVEVLTNVHALLKFHSGAVITLGASWDIEAHGHRNIEIYGSKGSLYVPDPNFFGGAVTLARRSGEEQVAAWDHPLGRLNWDRPRGPRAANYRGAGLADMAAAIREKRRPRCSIDFAVHVIEVLSAILQAAENGNSVAIASECPRPEALDPVYAGSLMAAADDMVEG